MYIKCVRRGRAGHNEADEKRTRNDSISAGRRTTNAREWIFFVGRDRTARFSGYTERVARRDRRRRQHGTPRHGRRLASDTIIPCGGDSAGKIPIAWIRTNAVVPRRFVSTVAVTGGYFISSSRVYF